MVMLLALFLISQTGARAYGIMPNITIDRPMLSVTSTGTASISVKAHEYKVVLYADAHAEDETKAQESAESMRRAIIDVAEEFGGNEKDVVLTNLNRVQPIEGDLYYRVEQDIEVWLKKIDDINEATETFLLIDGVQIGSTMPIISEVSEYKPAITKARKDAIRNAQEEAEALASEMGVSLGEPFYVTENIAYPTYAGYEVSDESEISVSVTIYYAIIYKK